MSELSVVFYLRCIEVPASPAKNLRRSRIVEVGAVQTGIRHWVLTCTGLAVAFGSSLANSSGRAGPASEDPDRSPTIIVRVFNYTKLSEKTVADAGAQAGRVFRRAGIKVLWLSCYSSKKGFERHPACESARGPTDIFLGILCRPKAQPSSLRYTLGFCAVPEASELGYLDSVYSDHSRGMAAGAGVPPAVVLGQAAAHEIGHLLLGTANHSWKGIMRRGGRTASCISPS